MRIIEFFSGTESFSNVARARGHDCRTLDYEKKFNPTYCMDFMEFKPEMLGDWKPDVIWASPDCRYFSQAAISHHWEKYPDGTYRAKTEGAARAIEWFKRLQELAEILNVKYYFIENPRSSLRKREVMKKFPIRNTVSYCQYGEKRQKPTDIWTNCSDWHPKPICAPKAKCHEAAPRGAKTGTQGMKDSTERARIPEQLCSEILTVLESLIENKKSTSYSNLSEIESNTREDVATNPLY